MVVEGQQTGVGGVSGAVIGGIAGGSVGGRREAAAVGVLSAVAGAVIGNTVERFGTREEAVEILLGRQRRRRALVRGQGAGELCAGQAVVLVTTGGRTG